MLRLSLGAFQFGGEFWITAAAWRELDRVVEQVAQRTRHSLLVAFNGEGALWLTNGSVDPSQDWTFNLYHGPNGYGGQAIASDSSYDDQDGILDFSNPDLDPARTYSVCQLEVPSGWSLQWKIDTDVVPPIAGLLAIAVARVM